MRRLQLAIVAAALIVAAQANATLTTLEFTDSGDSGGNGGSRRLTAQAEGDGSYSIVSGLSHLTSGPSAGANGTFVPNPDGPGAAPWGARVCGGPGREGVDDQMFPSGAAGVGVGGVGVGGPLFNDASYSRSDPLGKGLAFNLDNAGGMYKLVFNGYPNQPWAPVNPGGTLPTVPEPTTLIAGALLLLPFGVSTLRMFCRRTA